MKIIFLDIDGVMVPDYQKVNDQAFPKDNDWDAKPFSQKGMITLNNAILSTDARVVISSDWRKHYSLQVMRDIFVAAGILYGEDTIIGYTKIIGYGDYKSNRAQEILEWVSLHRPDQWVAIDDLDLSPYLSEDNFVHCKYPIEGIKQLGKRAEIEIKLGRIKQ